MRGCPELFVLKSPSGRCVGEKWIMGAASHACWAGTHAVDQLAAFAAADGDVAAPSISLDACIYEERTLAPPDVMKIDVEGAELSVLRGTSRAITKHHPSIFLEVHGEKEHADCRAFLELRGYQVKEEYG